MQNYEQYQDKTMTNTTNTDYHHQDNNNYTHAAGRFLTPEQCEAIREAYCDNIGPMTGAVAHLIERAFQSGLSADELVMAIEETGLAPRPSAYYLKAILENWVENGVTMSRLYHQVKANQGLKWWK